MMNRDNLGWFHSHWQKQQVRFLIVGGVNTLVGLVVYPVLYFVLNPIGFSYMLLLIMSQFICTNFSYLTNKTIVFKTENGSMFEYLKYNSFQVAVMAVNILALPLCVEVLKWNPVIAQTIYTMIVVVVSYFWHSKITFVEK